MESLLTLKVTTPIESIDELDYEQKRNLLIKSIESLDTNVSYIESED